MSDYSWSTSASRTLIQVDDDPTVVCIQAIEALVPDPLGQTVIHLAGGTLVTTPTEVSDLMKMIRDVGQR